MKLRFQRMDRGEHRKRRGNNGDAFLSVVKLLQHRVQLRRSREGSQAST